MKRRRRPSRHPAPHPPGLLAVSAPLPCSPPRSSNGTRVMEPMEVYFLFPPTPSIQITAKPAAAARQRHEAQARNEQSRWRKQERQNNTTQRNQARRISRFSLPSSTSALLRTPTLSLYLPLSPLPPAQESISHRIDKLA